MSDQHVSEYYASGTGNLLATVLDALAAAGRSTEPLDPDDLALLDEFHGLGRAATLALAELAGVGAGARILDIGAGIGGPARTFARHFGAQVIAVDPTERFCELNRELSRRAGLAERVEVVRADGGRLPFDDAGFDLVVTQAVWPSLEDKPGVLAEAHRVLRPTGQLAIFEAVAGPTRGELHYPVPWADGPEQSFVISAEEARRLAAEAGFAPGRWIQGPDLVPLIGGAAEANDAAMSVGVEGVDLSLVMPDFEARMAGLARNVEEKRIELAMAVFSRS